MDNGIIGDQTGYELPKQPTNEEFISELKKKARFSKSQEFKELRQNMQQRIDFYSQFLPGGASIHDMTNEERGKYWAVADLVTKELQAVIEAYDGSVKLLKEIDEK